MSATSTDLVLTLDVEILSVSSAAPQPPAVIDILLVDDTFGVKQENHPARRGQLSILISLSAEQRDGRATREEVSTAAASCDENISKTRQIPLNESRMFRPLSKR